VRYADFAKLVNPVLGDFTLVREEL